MERKKKRFIRFHTRFASQESCAADNSWHIELCANNRRQTDERSLCGTQKEYCFWTIVRTRFVLVLSCDDRSGPICLCIPWYSFKVYRVRFCSVSRRCQRSHRNCVEVGFGKIDWTWMSLGIGSPLDCVLVLWRRLFKPQYTYVPLMHTFLWLVRCDAGSSVRKEFMWAIVAPTLRSEYCIYAPARNII
jgi:hypothetical protein